MRPRWGAAIGTACGLFLGYASAASADPVPDASCPHVGGANTVTQGVARVAQTFTAGITGRLTAAEIRVTKNMIDPATGDYQLRLAPLASGAPTNDVLGTAIVPFASVASGSINVPITGTFSPPPEITAGTGYALVVTRPPAGANGLRLESQSPLVGCSGTMFISPSQTDPFTESGSGFDLTFTTFVEPAVANRAPTALLDRHPKRKTRKRKARFEFSADEPGTTFQCQIDARPPAPCSSPVIFKKLKPRKHLFTLTTTDTAGAVSPPASFRWKVLRP